jgi:hypothetical protein
MSDPQVPAIFQAFLKQKVEVTEGKIKRYFEGKECTINEYRIAPTDTTIKALKDVVAQQGMRLRVLLPETKGTADYRTDRLNALVAKTLNGDWKIIRLSIG